MIRGTRAMLLVDREQTLEDDPEMGSGKPRESAVMEFEIAQMLRKIGCDLTVYAFTTLPRLQKKLASYQPEVVFNVTEHIGRDRTGDVRIAAALEDAGVAYTGASPLGLQICRDKAVSKSIVAQAGVRTPRFTMAPLNVPFPDSLPPLPCLIKPVGRDSSEGIHMASIARTPEEVRRRVETVHRRYREPAIIEEFIAGVDVSVGVVETPCLRIMPARELAITVKGRGAPVLASYHVKHDDAYHARWGIRSIAAKLTPATQRQMVRDIKTIYPLLALRDYARIDYRLDPEGNLHFIEANPNPGIQPNSHSGTWAAVPFRDLVTWIVSQALARRGR